jgi:DNA polymerase-1
MKKVLLIDLMNMFIRNFSAMRITNDDGEHVGGAFGTLNSLQSQIKKHNPDIVSVVWEGKGSSERRRKTLKEYKEGRKFRGLNRYFEYSQEDESVSFARQLQLVKECLDVLPVYQPAVQYLEADDQIAYSCRTFFKDEAKIIISTDRDFFQLVDERTAIFRPVKTKENPRGELIDLDWMMQKEDVFPPNYALLKAIVGDKSDNIRGIKGVGEPTAKTDFPLLNNMEEAGVDDILEYAGKQKEKKYEKYIDNAELMRRNYGIVQLLDIDVNMQSIQALERSYENKELKFNSYQLRLKLLGENISPSNIDNWVSTFMSISRAPVTL